MGKRLHQRKRRNNRKKPSSPGIVQQFPVGSLRDASGKKLKGYKARQLERDELSQIFQEGPTPIAIVKFLAPVRWLSDDQRLRFWENELKERICTGNSWYLEDYPDEYCYLASEWHLENGEVVVSLELFD